MWPTLAGDYVFALLRTHLFMTLPGMAAASNPRLGYSVGKLVVHAGEMGARRADRDAF